LLWALTLPGEPGKEYRHKLGMGKPLGMGAVKITPHLILSSRQGRQGRYGQLFDESKWHLAEQTADATPYVEQFERYVLDAIGQPGAARLAGVERIRMLLTMLEWREGTAQWLKATSYMEVEAGPDKVNEYKERPVLPDPLAVVADVERNTSDKSSQKTQAEHSTTARTQQTTANSPTGAAGDKTGTVVRWVADRNYGFIKPDDGSAELFVHASDVEGAATLQRGQRVTFRVAQGAKGPQARNVRPLA
jgi:cold shock CspA family protein